MMADTAPDSPVEQQAERTEVLAPENAPSASGALTPMVILQAMTANGNQPDPGAINGLLAAQEKWERREAEKAFHIAFITMQETMPNIYKTKNVEHKGKHMYNHEELPEMLDILKPHLRTYGFYPRWETETLENGNMRVTCYITHSLGHSIFSEMSGVPDTSGAKNAIQATGSTASYLERYTLKAVLGISASNKDADGLTDKDATISEDQADTIKQLLETARPEDVDAGVWFARFLTSMEVDSLNNLRATDFNDAIKSINARIKK